MENERPVNLPWHGHETIAAVPVLLAQGQQLEITLPANYNHSLFAALHPHAPPAHPEQIDVSGGPELLTNIATVAGLEEFSELTETLKAARAGVRIVSPPTIMIGFTGS
jgi:hypothetical protein